jgi:hypothetical protein
MVMKRLDSNRLYQQIMTLLKQFVAEIVQFNILVLFSFIQFYSVLEIVQNIIYSLSTKMMSRIPTYILVSSVVRFLLTKEKLKFAILNLRYAM